MAWTEAVEADASEARAEAPEARAEAQEAREAAAATTTMKPSIYLNSRRSDAEKAASR